MKTVKSIMIVLAFISVFFISNVLYGGAFVSETTSNNNVDFAKIAKEIKKKEGHPPRAPEYIDVSKYFSHVINNKNIDDLRNELSNAGYIVHWINLKGERVENRKDAIKLTAGFIFGLPFYAKLILMRGYDSMVHITLFFNDKGRVTQFNATYFSDPH